MNFVLEVLGLELMCLMILEILMGGIKIVLTDKLNSIPSNGALVWCPLITTNFKNGTILVKPGR